MVWAIAIVKSALACRHTGFGCVRAASRLAQTPTASNGWLAPKMPKGLIRIMAPLAWLSEFGHPPPQAVEPRTTSCGRTSREIGRASCRERV